MVVVWARRVVARRGKKNRAFMSVIPHCEWD
jgi:hypothetical protein